MKKNYVSNSTESIRMFKSNFLETFSKVHWTVPMILYVPVVLVFAYLGLFVAHTPVLTFLGMFAAGLLSWTLFEYVLHRWIFHYVPKAKWALRLHFIFHGVHHDYPNDMKRLVMPPSVSIPLAFGVYFALRALMPPVYLYPFFSAFVVGYIIYDTMHYALHHFNFKGEFWKKIKKHHMLHHYSDASKGFGVSSELWDKVLNSGFPKKKN
ncbi:sterol desaturase family protein [Taibaiella helva]|uniref:sterol desaturase family protein n=1 Tax=Taibaiella helva TaxID=2301235 RepID=UPI000E597A72|nr:sterol desaturase family protein [Taibaiella helva]